MTNEEICQSIANIISQYRDREFGIYDLNHVQRWVSQFDSEEQRIVLEETNRILKRNFITKESFLDLIDTLIDSNAVYVGDKDQYWRNVSALEIQINGNSQRELNQLFSRKINERYGVNDLIGKNSTEFIYLDDFIFSGNRLFRDLESWITSSAPQRCRICIITIGWYIYGQWSTENKLKELATRLGKNIDFVFASYTDYRLENRLYRKDFSEVFWPTSSASSITEVAQYIEREGFEPKYRVSNGIANNVFTNARREQYENIILKYGLKIMSFPANNSPVVKPLGYSTFPGFGFGSTVFSFRNCPNNNPLVFWWGDPSAPNTHPFSKWYPLMQRDTYGF